MACGATAAVVMAGASGAIADDIYNKIDNTIDSTVEVMALNVGGPNGSTVLAVQPRNGDAKPGEKDNAANGCNLSAGSLVLSATSSNPGVATVSPTSVTFTSCGDLKTINVTPMAVGTTRITFSEVSNTTVGTFNLAPATFDVTVTGPSNTAPTVEVGGVSENGSYEYNQEPTATCSVTDKEDGNSSFPATITAGTDVEDGIGTFTASCSYEDKGGLTAASSLTYTVTKIFTSIALTCPTDPVTFTGSALELCSAVVSGRDLPTGATASIDYANNINAGNATVTASYGGDAHHAASSASGDFTIGKASPTVNLTCPSQERWTGSAIETCSATVEGAEAGATASLTYSDNTAVGTASVTANYTGDANHNDAVTTKTFKIIKAESVVSISCPESVTYSGVSQTPCVATVTGAGGLSESLVVKYADNMNAGTATAFAAYAGDDNHEAMSDSTRFEIAKAGSSVKIDCTEDSVYTGSELTPCTAVAQGVGMAEVPLTVSYKNNTNAGTATVSATWDGDANHVGSTGSKTFEIAKATSNVSISCKSDLVYTGEAQAPCTAVATGIGMNPVALEVSHANVTDAGTWMALAAWDGDDNHFGDSAEVEYTIAKAPSTIDITCDSGSVYTGSAIKPCSATVTGVGGLNEGLEVSYTDNVNAGTATAKASWAGDNNHLEAERSTTFEIAKAPSMIDIACDSGSVYTGSEIKPCSATVTGAGDLNKGLEVSYTDNVNAGTATATASFAGDNNHKAATKSTTFDIGKASSTVAISCPDSVWFTGSEITPCSATVAGAALNQAVPVSYSANKLAGTATAWASYDGDDNHTAATPVSKTFTIKGFTLNGFYKPVDMGMLNTVKAGSTVPLKFEVFLNGVERTDTTAVKGFSAKSISCTTAAVLSEAPIEVTSTGGTSLRYDTTGGQFIQNWQTPKSAGSCYRVTMTTIDGTDISADFKLK